MAIRIDSGSSYWNIGDTCTGTWSNNSGKFTHKWRIDELARELLESSTFSPEANDKIKWHLIIDPNTIDEAGNKCKINEICLQCTTSDGSKVTGISKLSVLIANGATVGTVVKKCHIFAPNTPICTFQESFLVDYYSNMTIICDILFVDDTITIPGICEPIRVEALKSRMSQDFGLLFESQNFSDVTLTVSGKDIPAHKMVLAARSPVFAAMLKHDMKELNMNRVTINDIDHEVVLEMLHFMYTDEAPNLEQMATNLLAAADKYGLERLKAMCVEALQKSLSIENAVDILVLSHLHNEAPLKDLVVNFVCKNINNMIETTSFKSIAQLYPELMIEIVRKLSTKWN